MNNTENSFIKNVNNIAANLELIKQVPQLFDEETILRLEKLSAYDITQITEDLKKGNYAGSRKLDIDLRLNKAIESASDYFQGEVADAINLITLDNTVSFNEAIESTKDYWNNIFTDTNNSIERDLENGSSHQSSYQSAQLRRPRG